MSGKPKRLPQLAKIRVKNTESAQQAGPCIVLMSTLLNCWSSNGESSPACKEIELSLKKCMETNNKVNTTKSSINYHANRLYPRINGKPHD